ncbi:MAG: hypothetical protein ACR2PZ_22865 [Pseudomonadales bacterium]
MTPTARRIDLVYLMGPPGSGKSTLGNELNRLGIADFTDLEPMLVRKYGSGEKFAKQRPMVHRWIRNFYREQLTTVSLPVVVETTGIGDRPFLEELCTKYRVLFVKLDTPRDQCVARVGSRASGQHVNEHSSEATGRFFDYWHSEIEQSYQFALTVTGRSLADDAKAIQQAL